MREAQYIGALVHNLAAAARLDAVAEVTTQADVDLGALVARVVARHLPIARSFGIALELAEPATPITVAGDVILLEQAIGNLVHNAVRYNRAGGHVAVLVEADAPRRFVVSVIDDGPGIEAHELASLLERGHRGDDARTRRPDGSGLGLDITQRVAERHGFELTFRASEAGGLHVELRGAAQA